MSKEDNIGDRYHSETKYYSDRSPAGSTNRIARPEPFKTYPDAETISLPEPTRSVGKFIWDIFSRRRSIRKYTRTPLSIDELSQLLWSIQGATERAGRYVLRTVPSAGALYPIETYIIVNRVRDLEAGIYHYDVRKHSLEVVQKGDFGADIAKAGLGQEMLQDASIVFVWTAIVARSKWKYMERGYRYIYMDAGHICQNAYLAAEAMGLGCCSVGAFFDSEVDPIIGIDGKEEITVYLCAIGKRQA